MHPGYPDHHITAATEILPAESVIPPTDSELSPSVRPNAEEENYDDNYKAYTELLLAILSYFAKNSKNHVETT